MFKGLLQAFGLGRKHHYGWGRGGYGMFGGRRSGYHGMSRGSLAGSAALPIAGYLLWRNRDRIGSWLQGLRGSSAGSYGRGATQGYDAHQPPGASAY